MFLVIVAIALASSWESLGAMAATRGWKERAFVLRWAAGTNFGDVTTWTFLLYICSVYIGKRVLKLQNTPLMDSYMHIK